MATFGGIEELKRICKELRLTPAFLSAMMLGRPAQAVIYRWLQGQPINKPEQFTSVLNLARALKTEAEKLGVGFQFRGTTPNTVNIWRAILLKSGYPVLVRKQDEAVIVALLARAPGESSGLRNEALAGEPVTVPDGE